MKKTGVFYHPSFSRRSYLTQGARLEDFPGAIEHILARDNVTMYESPPIEEEWILKVHTPELIRGVEADTLCSTAWHSAGGVVLAGEKICTGEIDNAFALIGAGGHHSGRNYFGGYCCFNDVVITITYLREIHNIRRFAIMDTDAHHGDGTRDLLRNDPEVLHVCCCGMDHVSEDGTKVDILAPGGYWGVRTKGGEDIDQIYADKIKSEFYPRVMDFKPDLIFWYFGFDTHKGDYGSLGLSGRCYQEIARFMLQLAEEATGNRLEVVLAGGSRTDIATNVIPPIIEILADWE
ncbi:MAG: histone deacetylase [Desulfobacterales bacterium]|uniref:Histone deacetylase n=1 Tax=Candidatus Desulfatibia vada TaxID=2841696 RepID=A0A8J6P1F1_9BACT|nr:histone deacetylase [Candidatus Desulfatibia vada]